MAPLRGEAGRVGNQPLGVAAARDDTPGCGGRSVSDCARSRVDDSHDFHGPRIHNHDSVSNQEVLIAAAAPLRLDLHDCRWKSCKPYTTSTWKTRSAREG